MMNILVICPDDLHCILSATPLIRKLAKTTKNAVDILLPEKRTCVLSNNPWVNKTWGYGDSDSLPLNSRINSLWRNISLAKILKRKNYEAVFIAAPSWRQDLLNWVKIIKPQNVIAFGEIPHPLITLQLPPSEPNVCLSESLYSLAKIISNDDDYYGKIVLYPDITRVKKISTDYAISLFGNYIGIMIDAFSAATKWPIRNWITLIHRISKQYPEFRLIIIWSSSEKNTIKGELSKFIYEMIVSGCSTIPLILIEPKNLLDLIALISLCSYTISSDIETTYLTAGLKVPFVAVNDTEKNIRLSQADACGIFPKSFNKNSELSSEHVLTALSKLLNHENSNNSKQDKTI